MSAEADGVALPPAVLRSARALGETGQRWLDELPDVIDTLEAHWRVRIGPPMSGGSAAFVARTQSAQGQDAVAKISLPDGLEGHSPFDTELRALGLGQGKGLADLYDVVPEHRAVLLERLGPPLRSRHLAVEEYIDVVTDTVRPLWVPPPSDHGLRTGRAQAEWLSDFISAQWERQGHPIPASTVDAALDAAHVRARAFDEENAVLIHGDAHPSNVLECAGGGPHYKLIDPDGMLSEPAHDLGVLLREWNDELRAAADPARRLRGWCEQAGARAGAEPIAVWQWALVERVSTGLFLCALADPASGRAFLEMATLVAAAPPN